MLFLKGKNSNCDAVACGTIKHTIQAFLVSRGGRWDYEGDQLKKNYNGYAKQLERTWALQRFPNQESNPKY